MKTGSLVVTGSLVAMTQALKDELRANGSAEHVAEFGDCLGRVEGLVDYTAQGEPTQSGPQGPEVDVRWLSSDLRYAYAPDMLQVVQTIIAVDGPAASGKGTLARRLATHYNLHYLDTGSLYRAVARDAQIAEIDLTDATAVVKVARALDPDALDDVGLRAPGVGEAASHVAKIPQVRAALLEYQHAFATKHPGAVLDGRDIGTVVCPNADAKLFVVATPQVRAWRRFIERQRAEEQVTYDEVLAQIIDRDDRDTNRGTSPMKISPDADLLDTTDMDISQSFDAAVGLIKRKIGQKGTC